MVAVRSTLLAAFFFATAVVAQDSSSAAAPSTSADAGGDTNGPADGSENTGSWNNATYFLSPTRGQQDYWVNGIENTAYWKPVPQPTYLTIANGNLTGFNGTKTLGEQIPGGTGSFKVQIDDYPVGTHYVLALLEQGTQRKLAQSQGFWIKVKGTQPASAQGAQGAPSAPGAGAGTNAGATGDSNGGGSAAPTGAAAPSGSSPAAAKPAGAASSLTIPGAVAAVAGAAVALLI